MSAKAKTSVDDVDHLLKAIFVLARTVDHVLETRAVESAIREPMSASKVQVLRLLGQRGSQTSSQIARYLGVTKPAVSQIIDAMVRGKQVVRKPSTQDRREVGLELTKLGRQLFQNIRKEQRHLVRGAVRLTSGTSRKKWVDTLQSITQSLAQSDRNFEEFCLQCGAHANGSCVLEGGEAECSYLSHGRSRARRTRNATKKPRTATGRRSARRV